METHRSSAKFQIIGAGFAGLALGIKLRERGDQVVIYERLEKIPRQVCGEYLTPEGVKVMAELGLAFALAGFAPIFGMKLISPNGQLVNTTFPEKAHGLSLNRQQVLQRLEQKFIELGGELRFNSTLSETGSAFLIGADGRQSKAAKLLELDGATILDEKRVAIHVYLKPLLKLERKGEMHIFGDGSYVGINPLSEHEANVSIVISSSRLKSFSSPQEALNHYLIHSPKLSQHFSPITHEEVRVAFPLGRKAGAIACAEGCLMGDAAGFIDPLTGEGMTSALKTVKILIEELNVAPTVSEAFYRYGVRRTVEFREKERLNNGFQKLIRSPLLCNAVGFILSQSENLRNIFIGVIGNVYTPSMAIKVIKKNYLEAHHG